MKFTGSVLGKIFLVLLCILLGIVIALGGIVGGAYFVLTSSTMNEISDTVSGVLPDGVDLTYTDEVGNMTVLEWGKELLTAVSDLNVTTVGQLESLVGYPVISDAIYEVVGVGADVIGESTFSNLGATITNSLTVEIASEKFEIDLPDMPLFNDEDFLTTPISDAFSGLTEVPLSQFVDMGDETNAVLLAIQDLSIDELGGEALTDAINELKLSEVIEIEEGVSNSVLVALKDTTIGELGGEDTDDIINSLFLGEIMEIDANSEKIMQTMKYASVESVKVNLDKVSYDEQDATFRASGRYSDMAVLEKDGYEYLYSNNGTAYVFVMENGEKVMDGTNYVCYKTKLFGEGAEKKNYPLKGINDTVASSTIGEIIDVDESDGIMWSLRDSTLDSISDDIQTLFLDQVMEIDETSSKTLVALKYAAISTVTEEIAETSIVNYSDPTKELNGYVYKYVSDGKGGYIPYVAKIGDDGNIEKVGNNLVLIKTKEYAGAYRPLISVDETIKTLLIGELIDGATSHTLKAISNSSLESVYSYINVSVLDNATATYVASHPDHATMEEGGFIYKYSALGLAYVCVADDDGNPIIEGGRYKVYDTKEYEGKYVPLRGLDDKMTVMTFGEVIEIDETDPSTTRLMITLKNERVEELDKVINRLFLSEMIEIDDTSAQVLQTIKYNSLEDSEVAIPVNSVVAPTSSEIAKQLDGYQYVYVNDNGKLVAYVNIIEGGVPATTTVGGVEHYRVYETKEYDGYDRPIVGINSKLTNLALGDVFTDTQMNDGVLSLLSKDTKLDDIGTEASAQIQNSSLAKLAGIGILDASGSNFNMTNMLKEQREFIWNSNITTMIESLIGFVETPFEMVGGVPQVRYDLISAPIVSTSTDTFNSLSEFVEFYQGVGYENLTTQKFDTVQLNANVTVNIDATIDTKFLKDDGKYYIPTFSLMGETYSLTFNGGDVVLAYMTDGCVNVNKHQFYYAYDGTNGGLGSGLNYFDGTTVSLGESKSVTVDMAGVPVTYDFIEFRKVA